MYGCAAVDADRLRGRRRPGHRPGREARPAARRRANLAIIGRYVLRPGGLRRAASTPSPAAAARSSSPTRCRSWPAADPRAGRRRARRGVPRPPLRHRRPARLPQGRGPARRRARGPRPGPAAWLRGVRRRERPTGVESRSTTTSRTASRRCGLVPPRSTLALARRARLRAGRADVALGGLARRASTTPRWTATPWCAADCRGADARPPGDAARGRRHAGRRPRGAAPMSPGSAVRIMTGAPLPRGRRRGRPGRVDRRAAPSGSRIRRAPDAGRSTSGAPARTSRRAAAARGRDAARPPRQLGLLAAVGHDRVRVHPRPRVVVMSTGSELVEPGRPLARRADLRLQQLRAGGRRHRGRRDRVPGAAGGRRRPRLRRRRSRTRLMRADVIVTTGGVSAGAYDAVKEVLSRARHGAVRQGRDAAGHAAGLRPRGRPRARGRRGRRPDLHPAGQPGERLRLVRGVRPPRAAQDAGRELACTGRWCAPRATEGWTSPAGKRQFARVVGRGRRAAASA